MNITAPLEAALRIALAIVPDQELARLWNEQRESPGVAPGTGVYLPEGVRERLDEVQRVDGVRDELARCRDAGYRIVHWLEDEYPAPLRDLPSPPSVLYLRGRGPWPPREPVTIVGARRSTNVGRSFARTLGEEIGARGGSVVSGLAIGIDQAAHEGAHHGGAACYAVLACGVDQIYPPGAIRLAERIEGCGCILSEMPLGTPPYRSHFPRRNRILAAVSRATLVIEADLRSGSLITAHRALELGRDVYAVPGSIDRASSRGTNRLIRDGAHPLLERSDVDLLLDDPRRARNGSPVGPTERILSVLDVPRTAEECAAILEQPIDDVYLRLVDLELDGRVRNLGGGLFLGGPTIDGTDGPAGRSSRDPTATSP